MEKVFYTIARPNDRIGTKFEHHPELDRVLYGTQSRAQELLDYVNKSVCTEWGDSLWKSYKISFEEFSYDQTNI